MLSGHGVGPLTVCAHRQASVLACVGVSLHGALVMVKVCCSHSSSDCRAVLANGLGYITCEGRCIIGTLDGDHDVLCGAVK